MDIIKTSWAITYKRFDWWSLETFVDFLISPCESTLRWNQSYSTCKRFSNYFCLSKLDNAETRFDWHFLWRLGWLNGRKISSTSTMIFSKSYLQMTYAPPHTLSLLYFCTRSWNLWNLGSSYLIHLQIYQCSLSNSNSFVISHIATSSVRSTSLLLNLISGLTFCLTLNLFYNCVCSLYSKMIRWPYWCRTWKLRADRR